jgi:hypothetical protein
LNSRIIITAPNHSFPRLAGIADDAAAWRLHFSKRELFDEAIQTRPLITRRPASLQSQPAADQEIAP